MQTETLVEFNQQFAKDVKQGFSQSPKVISSKYFYDDKGSQLFSEIMQMPEYYLTNCEFEVFSLQKKEIVNAFLDGVESVNLIELGAGNGKKTKLLLEELTKRKAKFQFSPIDISAEAMQELETNILPNFPNLDFNPLVADYFEALDSLEEYPNQRKVVMFLGANIGNYSREQSIDLINQISARLQPNDLLLIGFDLKKHPQTVRTAYSDPSGITKAFNLNLLERMNRELGANFNIAHFDHYAVYEPISGEARSYLVSQKHQKVHFEVLNLTFEFAQWEMIHTEISRKFDISQIEDLAKSTNFQIVNHFKDCRWYFNDSLWKK
ncbi:MAG: L-histidine N-alpha-methyltransferase [Arenicella sp.]|jgi:L-histidine N-alpha-methyltransferase